MILPFVRELLTDLEHCEPFERVRRHLALAAGRKRVSGLTATARALYLPLFARAAQSPVAVIVADNKAADTLLLTLRAACELTGAIEAERVLRFPGTRCSALRKYVASPGRAGAARFRAVEDRDRRRCNRHRSGRGRVHALLLRGLLCAAGAGPAP